MLLIAGKVKRVENIKLEKTTLLYTVFVLILVEPNYFKVVTLINRGYTIGRIAITIYILLCLIKMCRKIVQNKVIVFFFLVYGPLLISTVGHMNRVNDWYRNNISSILLSTLIIIAFSNNRVNNILRALGNLDLYLFINLVTIILFPNGLYKTELYTECWFLGYKNPQIRMVLPIMMFSIIYNYSRYGKLRLRARIDIFVAALTTIMVGSSTGIVGLTLCLLLLVVLTNRSLLADYIKRILNYKSIALIIGSIFIFVIWQGSRDNEIILYVSNFFNKGISFFSRVDFWNKTVQLILNSPIWGYGYLTSADFELMIGNPYAAHPHNYFLYVMCCGGIISFVSILFVIWHIFKFAYNNKKSGVGAITLAYITSLLVMGLTESLTEFVLLYPSLILVLAINSIKMIQRE